MSARSAVSAWVALLVVWAPAVAGACSVCSAGRDEENQLAFLLSTLFMSVTPLLVIGAIVYFLWRRIKNFEAEQEAHALRQTAVPTAAPTVVESR